jgi:tryptophan-rich sensory protein
MLSIVILTWVWAILFFVGAGYSVARFFEADQMKTQIMYAAMFLCCVQCITMMKVFAWQMIHRNAILREIRRLEGRIVNLA